MRTLMINPIIVNPGKINEFMDRYELRAPYCAVKSILTQVQKYSWPVKLRVAKPRLYEGNIYGMLVNIEAPDHLVDYHTIGVTRNHLVDLLPESIRNFVPRVLREIINNPDNTILEVAKTDEGIKIIGSMLEDMEK